MLNLLLAIIAKPQSQEDLTSQVNKQLVHCFATWKRLWKICWRNVRENYVKIEARTENCRSEIIKSIRGRKFRKVSIVVLTKRPVKITWKTKVDLKAKIVLFEREINCWRWLKEAQNPIIVDDLTKKMKGKQKSGRNSSVCVRNDPIVPWKRNEDEFSVKIETRLA